MIMELRVTVRDRYARHSLHLADAQMLQDAATLICADFMNDVHETYKNDKFDQVNTARCAAMDLLGQDIVLDMLTYFQGDPSELPPPAPPTIGDKFLRCFLQCFSCVF